MVQPGTGSPVLPSLGLKVLKPWELILAVQVSDEVRLQLDPMDRELEHRRPDVVLDGI